MLTMRSSSVTKMVKPPPPVPPRPSKIIVAEALAKRRRNPEDVNTIPVRSAPPPPPVDLSRSQSNACVSFSLKRPSAYDRSISDELKSNSRTIIFQSSNMKSANNNVLVRKDSMNQKVAVNNIQVNQSDNTAINNNKIISEVVEPKENNVVVTTKNIINSCDVSLKTMENCIKITQVKDKNSLRKSSESGDSSDEVTVNSENVVTCVVPTKEEPTTTIIQNTTEILEIGKSPTGSRRDPFGNSQTDEDPEKSNGFDEKWEEMLKDKNHVNMLIDEMFASVLEVSKDEETNKQICKTTSTTTITTDSTTITINGCDNTYESCGSVETNGSTVLIIESNDSQKIETHSNFNGLSLTKIRGSTETLDLSYDKSNSSTMEKKSVQFDDKKNAELLIEELECMRMEQERILKRQRKPSQEIYGSVNGEECDNEERMKNCHINIVNLNGTEKGLALDYERLKAMSSLHGLPPLPKSLSGFNLNENYTNPPTPVRTTSMRSHQGVPLSLGSGHMVYPPHKGLNGASELSSIAQGRKPTNLDAQLAILRREMYSLRQLDLSLLSQLWSLNESIQDFRQILQEQDECRVLSPPSPSPLPSSGDEGDGDEQYYINAPPATPSMKFRPAPPPPPPARRSSNSSNASTGG